MIISRTAIVRLQEGERFSYRQGRHAGRRLGEVYEIHVDTEPDPDRHTFECRYVGTRGAWHTGYLRLEEIPPALIAVMPADVQRALRGLE